VIKMSSIVAVRTKSNPIRWIKDHLQQGLNTNDVMSIQGVAATAFRGLSATLLTTEVGSTQYLGAETIIERGISQNPLEPFGPTMPMGVSLTGIPLTLENAQTGLATSDTLYSVRRRLKELLTTNRTLDQDFPILRPMDAIPRTITRDMRPTLEEIVTGTKLHGFSASLAEMLAGFTGDPLTSQLCFLAVLHIITPYPAHSSTLSLISKVGEFRETYSPIEGHGNPEPSRRYTAGRCRDYRRGIAPLMTGKSAHGETQEIVRHSPERGSNSCQSNVDLRAKYERKIGYALSRGREVALTALVASLSTNTVGALGVELTSDDYLAAYQKLIEAGLMEDSLDAGEDFSIFLSPAAWIAALKVDVFTNRQYNTAGDAIQRARIGDIYGFPVFVSNLMTVNGAGHDCVMMHRDCFALIVQKEVPVRSMYKIDNLADAVVGWNIFGVAELNFPPETAGGGGAVDNRGCNLPTV
jgi:hypothetical protein